MPSFKADRRLLRQAEGLYAEFLEVRDQRRPGEEYDLVQDWAEDLKVDAYFKLVPEETSPVETRPASQGDPDDRFSPRSRRTPLNFDAPERSGGKGMSLEGSLAASMAVTMYILDALQLFDGRDRTFVESVAFEVAMLGNYGLDARRPRLRSTRSRPSPARSSARSTSWPTCTPGFKELDPSINTELDFGDEYERAKMMGGLE